jgi:hypothetical protein
LERKGLKRVDANSPEGQAALAAQKKVVEEQLAKQALEKQPEA